MRKGQRPDVALSRGPVLVEEDQPPVIRPVGGDLAKLRCDSTTFIARTLRNYGLYLADGGNSYICTREPITG